MSNSSIWPIDRTLSGAITPGHRWPGSDGNEGYSAFPKALAEATPSDCLLSYPEHSLGESYHSGEMQSVYSAGPADWAIYIYINVDMKRNFY